MISDDNIETLSKPRKTHSDNVSRLFKLSPFCIKKHVKNTRDKSESKRLSLPNINGLTVSIRILCSLCVGSVCSS